MLLFKRAMVTASGVELSSVELKDQWPVLLNFTTSFLRRRADRRRYMWRASIGIYLALFDGVKMTL